MHSVLVTFLVAASGLGAAGSQEMRIPLGFVHQVSGSPVRLVSYASRPGSAYTSAVIRNQSDKDIAAVVFAVAIIPRNEQIPSEWIRTHEIAVPLTPAQENSVAFGLIPDPRIDEAHKKYGHGMMMELGIVDVLFEDGTRWTLDTKGRRTISGTDLQANPGIGKQQSSSPQPCAANAVPTPEQTARRRQGVQLARTIHNLQVNQPGTSAKKYLQQQDLGTSPFAARQTGASANFLKGLNFTPGAELSPGWELTLDVTSTGYWFMLKDKTDPCGLGFISNQNGLIFDARPLR